MTSLWPVRQLATSTPHCSGWTPSIGPSLPTCPFSSSENIPFLALSGCIVCPQTTPEVTSVSLTGSTGGLSSRMLCSLLMVGCAESAFSESGFDYPRQCNSNICVCVFDCSPKAALADPEFNKPRCEQQQHPEVGMLCWGGSPPRDHMVQKWCSTKAKPR